MIGKSTALTQCLKLINDPNARTKVAALTKDIPVESLVAFCETFSESKEAKSAPTAEEKRFHTFLYSPDLTGHWRNVLNQEHMKFSGRVQKPCSDARIFDLVMGQYHYRGLIASATESAPGSHLNSSIPLALKAVKLGSVGACVWLFNRLLPQIDNLENGEDIMTRLLSSARIQFGCVGRLLTISWEVHLYSKYNTARQYYHARICAEQMILHAEALLNADLHSDVASQNIGWGAEVYPTQVTLLHYRRMLAEMVLQCQLLSNAFGAAQAA